MGAALIAAGLDDVSSDAIVILSGETHKHIPLPNDPKSHKEALAHDDAEGWLAAERKELRNHNDIRRSVNGGVSRTKLSTH